MKRTIALLLALLLTLSLTPALAASPEAEQAAQALYDEGLFKGVGNNADGTPDFALDRVPTRNEGVVMLIRLLNEEASINLKHDPSPFTDLADWAKPYVETAYIRKLTTGTSETTFGGEAPLSVAQYLTLVMRALGYESGRDFTWDSPWELAGKLGLIQNGDYSAATTDFTRGDVAIISRRAMNAPCRFTTETKLPLAAKLGKFREPFTDASKLQGVWHSYVDIDLALAYSLAKNGVKYEIAFEGNRFTEVDVMDYGVRCGEGTFTVSGNKLHLDYENIVTRIGTREDSYQYEKLDSVANTDRELSFFGENAIGWEEDPRYESMVRVDSRLYADLYDSIMSNQPGFTAKDLENYEELHNLVGDVFKKGSTEIMGCIDARLYMIVGGKRYSSRLEAEMAMQTHYENAVKCFDLAVDPLDLMIELCERRKAEGSDAIIKELKKAKTIAEKIRAIPDANSLADNTEVGGDVQAFVDAMNLAYELMKDAAGVTY